MSSDLVNPLDSLEKQNAKLRAIAGVLMRRVEQITDDSGAAYAQFQRAAMLEDQVRERTRDLERALDLLNASNAALALANRETEAARRNLADAIETVQEGFALFDADDVLVLFNARFGLHMEDMRAGLRPGLRFSEYVEQVSRSRFLALPAGVTPALWAEQRMQRHLDRHVIFNARFLGDAWVQVSEHRTGDGGTVVLQTDISAIIQTERRERGKLLDDQARVIRATLDHINQGVAIFDANGDLVGWNQRLGDLLAIPLARMLNGVSFEALFQRFQTGFSLADMDEARLMAWVEGPAGRAALTFEIRRGSLILAVFAQEMPESGFVMSFTDVSAERQAIEGLSAANETLEARVRGRTLQLEDALADAERANASRSRFVAAASHDLLQPLSAAKLFMASIGDEAITPAARGALDKAQNALMSVEGILGSLLDISKLESGKVAVQVGPVRMGALLAQLQEEFAGFAQAKGLGLIVHSCDYVVESDPGYLRRILQNLIGNAIRYTARGRVMVGARRRGSMLRLEVWDTGPGIPETEQDNIFKEFHRLNARASASEGMGLGLAIVERACALLGHPLELRSRLGHGSGFMVQVPILNIAAKTEVFAAQSNPVPMQDRIVFLVENDEDLRRAMGLLLEKWGVHVLEAASGEEALALIDDLGILPDFLLVDHQLGAGMTGLEFIAELTRQHGVLPLLLVTAERSGALAQACAARGVAILHKPIDAMALREIIAGLEQAKGLTTKGA